MELSGGAIDVLFALEVRGPLDDGDLPSKVGMSELIENKLAIKNYKNDLPNSLTLQGHNQYRVEFAKRLPRP